jgi:hypothetical protein
MQKGFPLYLPLAVAFGFVQVTVIPADPSLAQAPWCWIRRHFHPFGFWQNAWLLPAPDVLLP